MVITRCYKVKGNKDGSISLWVHNVLSVCIFENLISENTADVCRCLKLSTSFCVSGIISRVGMHSVTGDHYGGVILVGLYR